MGAGGRPHRWVVRGGVGSGATRAGGGRPPFSNEAPAPAIQARRVGQSAGGDAGGRQSSPQASAPATRSPLLNVCKA